MDGEWDESGIQEATRGESFEIEVVHIFRLCEEKSGLPVTLTGAVLE